MSDHPPAEAFPAGEFIIEELDARGWTQRALASIMDVPPATISEIISGKRGITPETARRLGAAFGTSPELWLRLDASYQLWRLGEQDSDDIRRRSRIYALGPIDEFIRRGWIAAADDLAGLEANVLRFFGMESFADEPCLPAFSAETAQSHLPTLSRRDLGWTMRADHLARGVDVSPFRPHRLPEIGDALSELVEREDGIRRIPKLLNDAGIRFVVVKPLEGSLVDGASFWQGDTPVVVLSLRRDRAGDVLVTLLHELGHLDAGEGAVDTERDVYPLTDTTSSESESPSVEVRAQQFVQRHLPAAGDFRQHPIASSSINSVINRGRRVPVRDELSKVAPVDGWSGRANRQAIARRMA